MYRIFVIFVVVLLLGIPGTLLAAETAPIPNSVANVAADEMPDWYGQISERNGLAYNPSTKDWDGFATVPVIGYKAVTLEFGVTGDPTEKNDQRGPKAAVLALTYNLGSLEDFGVDVFWADYISFHVGPYIEYNFESGELSGGGMCSALEFSFDQGNVERQKASK